ncbi:DUF6203 family protein [Nonomuraea monospora]
MKKLFQLLLARRLAGTPIGMAAILLGWFLARRKRRRRAYQAERETERVGRRYGATSFAATRGGRSRASSPR